MATPHEKLQILENLEREIGAALQSAGQSLQELGKEKMSMKQVEIHTQAFLKTIESVETGLTSQINYLTQVSTSQPHEGSSYAVQKDRQMAFHRVEHMRSRLQELERLRADHLRGMRPAVGQQGQRGALPESVTAMQRGMSQPMPSQGAQRMISLNENTAMQRSHSMTDGH